MRGALRGYIGRPLTRAAVWRLRPELAEQRRALPASYDVMTLRNLGLCDDVAADSRGPNQPYSACAEPSLRAAPMGGIRYLRRRFGIAAQQSRRSVARRPDRWRAVRQTRSRYRRRCLRLDAYGKHRGSQSPLHED
jgi:hypothetical protein